MNPKPQGPISCHRGLVLDADRADPAKLPKATGCCGTGGATNKVQSGRSSVGPSASAAPTEFETAVTITRASAEDLGGVLRLLESLRLPTAGVADHFCNFFVAREDDGRLAGAIGLGRYGTLGYNRNEGTWHAGHHWACSICRVQSRRERLCNSEWHRAVDLGQTIRRRKSFSGDTICLGK